MYCLKCGRDTGGKQVFCKACQDSMKRYPIKPDAKVLLPQREAESAPRRQGPRKRPLSLEERLARLKLCNRWLVCSVLLLSILFSLSVAYIVRQNDQLQFSQLVGRNYSIDTTAD